MRFIINLMLTTIAVYCLGQILPGITVESFGTALVVAVLLKLANATLRPLLFLLTLPINVMTLGLFSFVIMGLMVWIVSHLVTGFGVASFLWAITFALMLVILNAFFKLCVKKVCQSNVMIPLLEALEKKFPDSSKRTLRQWIKWGRVLIDGHPCQEQMVAEDAVIDLEKKQTAPMPILYQDRYFIAIDKPANLLSVPSNEEVLSALTLLRGHFKQQDIFAAHRLDQGASGVLLFVRGMAMREQMAQMFGKHDLIREYHAIVEGRTPPEGVWEFPLQELENYHVIVSEEGRESHTSFKRLRYTARFSHLHISLKTGRKHQIRVHTSHVGHPIIGDKRYGSLANPIKRLGLHAKRLAFSHPITHKWIEVVSPLPKSFDHLGANCV